MNYSDYAGQGQAQVMNALKEKLSENKWREADELTKILMIKTSTQKNGNYISLDLSNLPIDLLEEIDELWKKHSNSYFGFSVQKKILNREKYFDFIKNVGWHKEDSWLSYADLFVWETVSKGHLPYCGSHFWKPIYIGSSSSSNSFSLHQNHFHQSHYHPYHPPHRQSHSGDNAAGAAMAAAAMTAAPWLIGAAVVGVAGYLIYREVTKDERKRKERLEREEEERQEKERRLEEENQIQKNIESLLALL